MELSHHIPLKHIRKHRDIRCMITSALLFIPPWISPKYNAKPVWLNVVKLSYCWQAHALRIQGSADAASAVVGVRERYHCARKPSVPRAISHT